MHAKIRPDPLQVGAWLAGAGKPHSGIETHRDGRPGREQAMEARK